MQASAVRGAYLFSSQRGDGRGAAYLRLARGIVQELHESSLLGIHVAELRTGVVGDDFAADYSGLFFDEYL
jgi:hypothetical protein